MRGLLLLLIPVMMGLSADGRVSLHPDYYRNHFLPQIRKQYPDTLFSRTIYFHKVSHLIRGTSEGRHRITLLFIQPWPDTWKSQNFPVHYEYSDAAAADLALRDIDKRLRRHAVWQVELKGDVVRRERIIFPGLDHEPGSELRKMTLELPEFFYQNPLKPGS